MLPVDSIVANWSHQWYGFWRSDDGELDLPQVEAVADADWSGFEQKKVVSYLLNAPLVVVASGPNSKCLLCEELCGSSAYRSDGCWLWPDDLAHYVDQHNVSLPPSFLTHLEERNFQPPVECPVAIEELPWP